MAQISFPGLTRRVIQMINTFTGEKKFFSDRIYVQYEQKKGCYNILFTYK